MGELYLYSNIAGSFILDSKLKIKDKILLKSQKEIYNNCNELSEGKISFIEQKLLSKYSKSNDIIIIGFKNEENTFKTDFNDKIFLKINEIITSKGAMDELRTNNLIITKNDIKNSVRDDLLIIQAINNIKELDKVANTLVKRLREWYSFFLPELSEDLESNEKFSELVSTKTREKLLKELKLDDNETMGALLSKIDQEPIKSLAKQIHEIYSLRKTHEDYLDKKMEAVCPNVRIIAGSLIGAKLVQLAGSLERLATFPASTVQILGAEKALFRHLRNKKYLPPKYGVLHEHPFVSKVEKKNKGKIARTLADKISIAAKVDHFKGKFMGTTLRDMVEKKVDELSRQKGKSKRQLRKDKFPKKDEKKDQNKKIKNFKSHMNDKTRKKGKRRR